MTATGGQQFGQPQERDWNALSLEEFREMVRTEFAMYPHEFRFPSRRLRWAEQSPWYLRMASKGWIAPNWGTAWGGMGLDAARLLTFIEEQEAAGIARYQDHGVRMIGPALIAFGTPEQHERFLPPILSCEDRYAQGFSEPNAGSDLASLRSTARPTEGGFSLNGRKTWTTMAHDVTHLFVLARTGEGEPRRSMGLFLVPVTTPGLNIRPIRDIAGHDEFCEVTFDDVEVSALNVIGSPDAGWDVAMSILSSERIHLGAPALPRQALQVLRSLLEQGGEHAGSHVAAQVAELELDVQSLSDLYERFAADYVRGKPLGAEVSALKIWSTETFQRIANLIIEIGGAESVVRPAAGLQQGLLDTYYKALPSSIYGGTNEIQHNIIARRVLGLGRPR